MTGSDRQAAKALTTTCCIVGGGPGMMLGFLLALLAGTIGLSCRASAVESVTLEPADLKVGGSYPAQERQALLGACQGNFKVPVENKSRCGCVADMAGTVLSRFGRLLMTAELERNADKVFALVDRLRDTGMPQAEADSASHSSTTRINDLIETCALEER